MNLAGCGGLGGTKEDKTWLILVFVEGGNVRAGLAGDNNGVVVSVGVFFN